jgi:hypothetical protein
MTMQSAFDDFVVGTLGALPSLWQKLEFVASLRADDGRYEHWGMVHTYGQRAADEAIARAHTEVFARILATPIQQLYLDANTAQAEDGGTILSHCDDQQTNRKLLPKNLAGADERHLNLILRTLSLLACSRAVASHQGA